MREQSGFQGDFREIMLRGRKPLDYILSEVEVVKKAHENAGDKWTNDDLAMALTARIRLGVIGEEDMEESLPYLGLTFEDADALLGASVPRALEYFALQDGLTAGTYKSLSDVASTFRVPGFQTEPPRQ